MFERLEPRRLMSVSLNEATRLLSVDGTPAADAITVRLSHETIVTTVNGETHSFAASSIRNIKIMGYTGEDRIDARGVPNTCLIYGQGGSDTILGGDGPDLIDGGDDNDYIYAGAGNDTVYGGQGHDFLFGNAGDDLFQDSIGMTTLRGGPGEDSASVVESRYRGNSISHYTMLPEPTAVSLSPQMVNVGFRRNDSGVWFADISVTFNSTQYAVTLGRLTRNGRTMLVHVHAERIGDGGFAAVTTKTHTIRLGRLPGSSYTLAVRSDDGLLQMRTLTTI